MVYECMQLMRSLDPAGYGHLELDQPCRWGNILNDKNTADDLWDQNLLIIETISTTSQDLFSIQSNSSIPKWLLSRVTI